MTDRTYSQSEADALIAGAYLAVDAMISKGWHSDQCASLRNQWHIDDPEACDCWNGLLRASVRELPPDDARLALEEREAKVRDDAFEEVVAMFQGTLKAWTPYETIQVVRALKGKRK